MSDVQFRISSALKTIIGKELITDDFIAMFELVKNSFDAQARRVDITFDSSGTDAAQIVIQDDGDGMDKSDLIDRWMFVAYSAKKDQQDYRDKIAGGRVFAGAKGIGRFSCDRLGAELTIYTRKHRRLPWNVLSVNWSAFEADAEEEFQQVPAKYETIQTIPYELGHGTVLLIGGLRSRDWSRDKLIRLRRSLERLVNPNQENDAENFAVHIHCEAEKPRDSILIAAAAKDGKEAYSWELVNGQVKNFLFETLEFKTAQIVVEVRSNGTEIHTRLIDRGRRVYSLVEVNPYSSELDGIRVILFALNRASKYEFTKRMGMRVYDYGSVFVYKNGFRINPFGNPGEDSFGIDARHLQGFFRTFGTRDLTGRVEINGPSPAFQETSSRDGGFVQNQAFSDLRKLVKDIALERLETFAIDLTKFGLGEHTSELPTEAAMSSAAVKAAIFEIITRLTKSSAVIRVEYDPDFLDILENRSAESVGALLGNLKRIAVEHNSPEIDKEIRKAEKQLKLLAKAKAEAEEGEQREKEKAARAERRARASEARAQKAEEEAREARQAEQVAIYQKAQLDTQNVFLKAALSKDFTHVISLHHSIGQNAMTINQMVHEVFQLLKGNSTGNAEKIKPWLDRISFMAKSINAITKFATQANHRATQEEAPGDLIEFIREYLLNIYHGFVLAPNRSAIPIMFHQEPDQSFQTTFAPINITIIFENLISNARKTEHKATQIEVSVVECSKSKLVISFSDNGLGIPKRNLEHLFEIGFSTTDGSGLGLHHIRTIMKEIGGSIEVPTNKKQGAEFLLVFPRTK